MSGGNISDVSALDAAYKRTVNVERSPEDVEKLTPDEMRAFIESREQWSVRRSQLMMESLKTAGQLPATLTWGDGFSTK